MTMMKARTCTYEGDRDERIVASLYGELESSASVEFASHVAACAVCREELAALGNVRSQLAQWTPPVPVSPVAPVLPASFDGTIAPQRARGLASWREIPAWAQVAAALLFVGVAAGIAHLEISYDQRGLSVRTGWLRQDLAPEPATAEATVTAPVPVSSPQPWRRDLDTLERQLRSEFRTMEASPPSRQTPAVQRTVSEADLARSVRPLIEESERRQQRELALRLAEAARDTEVQRRADLQKIDSMIQGHVGAVQNTGFEVMRQRQMLNDLAIRVSQRP